MKETGLTLSLESFGSLKRDIYLFIEDRCARVTLDLSHKLFYQCYFNVLNYPKPSNEDLIPRNLYEFKKQIARTLAKDSLLDSKYSSLFHLFWDHLYNYMDPYAGFAIPSCLYRINNRIFIEHENPLNHHNPSSPDIYGILTKHECLELFDNIHTENTTPFKHSLTPYLIQPQDKEEYLFMPELPPLFIKTTYNFYNILVDTFLTLDISKVEEEAAEELFDYLILMLDFLNIEAEQNKDTLLLSHIVKHDNCEYDRLSYSKYSH